MKNNNTLKGYDENKFRILSDICKNNNAGVVLSSSWKFYYTDNPKFNNELTRLINAFTEYEIPFYGFAGIIKDEDITGRESWYENSIFDYLSLHPEVESFCIITTDNYELDCFQDNRVITDYNEDGLGNGGLLPKHKEEVSKILSKKHK